MPRHVRKGDQVIVTAGNDRGRTGEIVRVVQDGERVVVKGVNVRTKHLKPTQQRPQGGIVRQEMAIHVSNVSPVVDGKPSRVRFQTKSDGSKVRVASRTGGELSVVHTARKVSSAPGGNKLESKVAAKPTAKSMAKPAAKPAAKSAAKSAKA
ncbi:MAG: 50S ribosomal protein L24 [Phycisphaerae bacterium]|nr:50S ribosomal protein L24 [Phycisphaerae bacterium]